MSSLEKMLQKMKVDPVSHSAPLPLIDEAFVALNNEALTFTQKKAIIEELEQQASGYELTCFADVHESLLISATMVDLSTLNEPEQD